MSPKVLHLDFETFSRADLGAGGAHKYAADSTTEVLLAAYSFGHGEDEPVHLWPPATGEPMPEDLQQALADDQVQIWAHNAQFERLIINECLRIAAPPERFRCTMVWGTSLSLPASLDMMGKAIGIHPDAAKLKDGKRLIRKFCMPAKPTKAHPTDRWLPDEAEADWMAFAEYCRRDVVAEKAIACKLARFPMPEAEWKLYALDQRINDRGLPADTELAQAIVDTWSEYSAGLLARLQQLTGLDNPNSVMQMRGWLRGRGYALPGLDKVIVRDLLDRDDLPADVREALQIRQELAKASVKKADAVLRAASGPMNVDPGNNRIRGAFQMNGAGRTGRWAGRLVQPQNLAGTGDVDVDILAQAVLQRDAGLLDMLYGDVAPALSKAIRPCIAAPEGKTLAVADLSSIESVMLAWASRCGRQLQLFRDGKDTYKDFASVLFGIPYEQVTKPQRKYAKPPTLGCGYMLGAKGLVAYAKGFGVAMTEEEAQQAVDVFRSTYPEIPAFWNNITEAAFEAVASGHSQQVIPGDGRFVFEYELRTLRLRLPSGRHLTYVNAGIEDRETPWGEVRPTLCYDGLDQITRQWSRISTHGGKLTENLIQAVARDVLVHGLFLFEQYSQQEQGACRIVGHVHDEILAEAPQDRAEEALQTLIDCMSTPPAWCPDAPLGADGWIGKRYRKD